MSKKLKGDIPGDHSGVILLYFFRGYGWKGKSKSVILLILCYQMWRLVLSSGKLSREQDGWGCSLAIFALIPGILSGWFVSRSLVSVTVKTQGLNHILNCVGWSSWKKWIFVYQMSCLISVVSFLREIWNILSPMYWTWKESKHKGNEGDLELSELCSPNLRKGERLLDGWGPCWFRPGVSELDSQMARQEVF